MLDAARPARPTAEPLTQSPLLALGLALVAAIAVGILAAATHPIVAVGAVLGLTGLTLVFARPLLGVFAFVAVVAFLPYGVLPVRVGVQLTFVDILLIATYAAVLVRVPGLALRRDGVVLGIPGTLLLLFATVSVAAYVVGTGHSPGTPELLRRFAKLLASLLFFLVVRQLVRTPPPLFGIVRGLMLAGAFAGGVGAVLWALPHALQLRLLNALGLFGYPTGDVLRFVPGENDTYSTQLRAIGTAVDPNVFGGTLVMALALMAIQWSARDRLFSRPFLLLLALPTVAGVVLSFSRGSWVGLAAAVLLFGPARYRLFWVLLAAGGLLALPGGRDVIARFVSGFSSADPATALRFGELNNALTLIQRYPWLGIGYGASPDIDVTAGVSSVYLLVGEQAGLVGLTVFLAALGSVVLAGVAGLRRPDLDARTRGVVASLLAALTAAMVAGSVDHYFANMSFPHAVALFWLYAALLVAAARMPAPDPPAPR